MARKLLRRFILRDDAVRSRAAEFMVSVPLQPMCEVIFQEWSPDKTRDQEKKFHAMVGEIAEFIGEDPESMKYIIKKDILGFERRTILGAEYEIVMSTTKLNVKEYAHLIEQTYRWAAERGIPLSQ